MSTEERVRAATRARAGLVRQVRPLELPDELPARGRRSRHTRPARRARAARDPRRWLNWGAPLAAAALVTALALVLVVLRQAPAPQPGPAAPTSAPSIPASVPRYYVVLDRSGGIVVADDRTGRTVVAFPAPVGQDFTGVTAAADDLTFVLSSFDHAKAETTWYLLRITPGVPIAGGYTEALVPLPIKPLRAQVSGLALSPDGRELAVMFAGASGLQLSTYSVSSGALLGSWHTSTAYWMLRTGGANAFGLSWLADGRHVSFRFDAYAKNSTTHLVTVRTLDVAAAGHDLIADSRLDLQTRLSATAPVPTEPCFSSLTTPDGGTVICGTAGITVQAHPGCTGTPPSFDSYSAATGKPLRVLYLSYGPCSGGVAVPLWTDSSASQVIGLISDPPGFPRAGAPQVGLIVDGNLTLFPGSVVSRVLVAGNELGGIAF
jgi:hypothetical protein